MPPALRADPELLLAVVDGLLDAATAATTLAPAPPEADDKKLKGLERALLKQAAPLLAMLAKDDRAQVAVLNGAQALCHARGMPKGLFLRLCKAFYEDDVVDVAAFMKWRDDVTDRFPGKGAALMAVNEFLNWMAEDDDDDDDDE